MGAPTEDPKSDKITSAIVSMLNQEANPYFLKQLRNANASHNGPPR
jgi:hypothetical protein